MIRLVVVVRFLLLLFILHRETSIEYGTFAKQHIWQVVRMPATQLQPEAYTDK